MRRVHAEDVDELRDDTKLPFSAEGEPVENAEDVEEEDNEADDGTDQEDPLDNVDVSASFLNGAKTGEAEVSDKQDDATYQRKESTDEIRQKNVFYCWLEHNVIND